LATPGRTRSPPSPRYGPRQAAPGHNSGTPRAVNTRPRPGRGAGSTPATRSVGPATKTPRRPAPTARRDRNAEARVRIPETVRTSPHISTEYYSRLVVMKLRNITSRVGNPGQPGPEGKS